MRQKLEERFNELTSLLKQEMNPDGFWTGELSSSALAVAVAIAALHFDDSEKNKDQISRGLNWLTKHINNDGSFGDTPESPGNISTTLLVFAATNLYVENNTRIRNLQSNMSEYLMANCIDVFSPTFQHIVLDHYQKDYTFSVPILTMCALCGIPGEKAFQKIPQLPFELAILPRKFYRFLNLNVVSYAIPALVAVGLVIFSKKKSFAILKGIRKLSIIKALDKLDKMLPESGGFLEAIPHTAFVCLSLINAGYGNLEVVKKGITFLKDSQRSDGSWPIDIDLSTWVTTLSIKALRSKVNVVLNDKKQEALTNHLTSIQNQIVHPFNGTSPGGWGWTNFSGSVPDGDDTPGAMLSLLLLNKKENVRKEILHGAAWLIELQNKDGGFPTFSRGWGKLPFDQSCADLTGHCLLALSSVLDSYELNPKDSNPIFHSCIKALHYLQNHQLDNGAWLPLWFGNQYTPDHTNPVYGTAKVLTYLQDIMDHEWLEKSNQVSATNQMVNKGIEYLLSVQNADGSWGGDKDIPGSIEETSLAISALLPSDNLDKCHKAFAWLDIKYNNAGLKAAPIGLYFASLWYDEKMYPLTSYLEATTRFIELID